MNKKEKLFTDEKMLIMLAMTYKTMPEGLQEYFDKVVDKWIETYGNSVGTDPSLLIEVWNDGQKYFIFELYGYVDNKTLYEPCEVETSPESEEKLLQAALKQIMESFSIYDNLRNTFGSFEIKIK